LRGSPSEFSGKIPHVERNRDKRAQIKAAHFVPKESKLLMVPPVAVTKFMAGKANKLIR
jgi:hypothetical protein